MEIKQARREPWLRPTIRRLWANRRFTTIAAYTAIVVTTGAFVHRSGVPQRGVRFAESQFRLLPRIISGRLSKPEHFTIDVKHKDYLVLVAKREEALARGILLSTNDDYVPATIRHGQQVVRVKLRLKGDMRDHWESDRWSFRIVVRDNQTILGMKQFSIQQPKTRNYLFEWFYHRLLQRENLIGLRYDFIDVTLNGKRLGTYAVEEHFDKHLIEANRRREGPILRFNEDLLWAEVAHHEDQDLNKPEERAGSGSFQSSIVDGFQSVDWLADPTMRPLYLAGVNLLEGFRQGTLSAKAVFDVEAMGRFIAVNELIGTQHAANWRNIRFYYNPVTARLEPIGFDAQGGDPLQRLAVSEARSLSRDPYVDAYHALLWHRLFGDPDVQRAYFAAIERLSAPQYLNAFLDSLAPEIDKRLQIIHRDNPEADFDPQVLRRNATYLRRMLMPVKRVHAWIRSVGADSIDVDVGNIQLLPLELTAVRVGTRTAPVKPVIRLPSRYEGELVSYRTVRLPLPTGVIWSDSAASHMELSTRVVNTSALKSDPVYSETRPTGIVGHIDGARAAPNIAEFPFVRVLDAKKTIEFLPGNWTLKRDAIVPGGYRLIARAGVHLKLTGGASLISHSPVEFTGSEELPVIVESDSTGGGMVVLGAGATSVLEYAVFRGLRNPAETAWTLTGAVTFYESPVDIVNCLFEKNASEDALNLVRSPFRVEASTFLDTPSDALDVDFGTGTVSNTRFARITNDALDFSGSSARVRGVTIDDAGDKGVSAGEHSTVSIVDTEIRNANVGVASKDLSLTTLDGVVISGGRYGLAAYRKKPEFGGGELRMSRGGLHRLKTDFLRDAESTIVMNGTRRGKAVANALRLVDPGS